MDAPVAVLWALSALFVALAVPCLYRLVLAHPQSPVRCRVNRLDEAAEMLMCVGMLAMVSPLGGPIPLAGLQAAFVVATVGLAATWAIRLRRTGPASCVASRCGHHALSAAVMVVMLLTMAGHGPRAGEPWLVLAGHGGAQGWAPALVALAAYLFVDMALAVVRMVRSRAPASTTPATHAVFSVRSRESGRAVMSAAMAGMLLTMA